MSRHRITILERPTTIVVRGWRGGELAREAGLKPLWGVSANGWLLDAKRLPDLLAYLEYRRIAVTVTTERQ